MAIRKKQLLQDNEQGVVSLLITVMLMIVMSLIVISFAKLVRREQRQVLDRQLNTQAFYAAESGIHDAQEAIRQKIANPVANNIDLSQDYMTNCPEFMADAGITSPPSPNGNVLDSAASVSYTCLLVDPDPTTLVAEVGKDHSIVMPVKIDGLLSINEIEIQWEGTSEPQDVSACPALGTHPATWPSSNCDVGMLRIDAINTGGVVDRANLTAGAFTVFAYPTAIANTGEIIWSEGIGPVKQGATATGNCSGASVRKCSIKIKGMIATGINSTSFHLRLLSIYQGSRVTICSPNCASANELKEAQAVIDATGKANDVLRRIQVRVPLGVSRAVRPDFGLQSSQTICKRFAIAPGAAPIVSNPDPSCQVELSP